MIIDFKGLLSFPPILLVFCYISIDNIYRYKQGTKSVQSVILLHTVVYEISLLVIVHVTGDKI